MGLGLTLTLTLTFSPSKAMVMTLKHAKGQGQGQLVQKIEWKQTDRDDCIASHANAVGDSCAIMTS